MLNFSIGTGEASVTLNTRTKGSKPILPEKNRFIELSSHSITLHLEAWNDGGCHMSHFVVENKRKWVWIYLLQPENFTLSQFFDLYITHSYFIHFTELYTFIISSLSFLLFTNFWRNFLNTLKWTRHSYVRPHLNRLRNCESDRFSVSTKSIMGRWEKIDFTDEMYATNKECPEKRPRIKK